MNLKQKQLLFKLEELRENAKIGRGSDNTENIRKRLKKNEKKIYSGYLQQLDNNEDNQKNAK